VVILARAQAADGPPAGFLPDGLRRIQPASSFSCAVRRSLCRKADAAVITGTPSAGSERLDSPEAVGQEAGRRTVRRLGARKITTCRVPVVFEPEIAGSFPGQSL